jgi:4'-phosphopantetheinyl transferase
LSSPSWLLASQPPPLGAEEVHVWRHTVVPGAIVDPSALSPAERERAGRFQATAERNTFLAARSILRRLLAHYVDAEPAELSFAANDHGKPGLAGPHAGACQFNTSHSRSMVLLAFARSAPVGVDIESRRRDVNAMAIARRFFAPAEAERLAALAPVWRRAAFLRYWTVKEAYAKARGVGLTAGLSDFVVTFPSHGTPRVTAAGDADPWSVHELAPAPDYAGAVAMAGSRCEVRRLEWRLA